MDRCKARQFPLPSFEYLGNPPSDLKAKNSPSQTEIIQSKSLREQDDLASMHRFILYTNDLDVAGIVPQDGQTPVHYGFGNLS